MSQGLDILPRPLMIHFLTNMLDRHSIVNLLISGVNGTEFLRDVNGEVWHILLNEQFPEVSKEENETYQHAYIYAWSEQQIGLSFDKHSWGLDVQYALKPFKESLNDTPHEFIHYLLIRDPDDRLSVINQLFRICVDDKIKHLPICIKILDIIAKTLEISYRDTLIMLLNEHENRNDNDCVHSFVLHVMQRLKLSQDDYQKIGERMLLKQRFLWWSPLNYEETLIGFLFSKGFIPSEDIIGRYFKAVIHEYDPGSYSSHSITDALYFFIEPSKYTKVSISNYMFMHWVREYESTDEAYSSYHQFFDELIKLQIITDDNIRFVQKHNPSLYKLMV